MTRGWTVVVAGALMLIGCSESSNARATRDARAAVKARMLDPGSSRFRNLYIVDHNAFNNGRDDRLTVCGQVDGKNRAGSYVGYHAFGWSNREGSLRFDASRPATIERQRDWCGR